MYRAGCRAARPGSLIPDSNRASMTGAIGLRVMMVTMKSPYGDLTLSDDKGGVGMKLFVADNQGQLPLSNRTPLSSS